MNPLEAARLCVEHHHPDAIAAFLGGSVAAGRGTATSDLDVLIITEQRGPYRETLREHGWLIETFVHTPVSFDRFLAMDRNDRRPILARMCAEGVVVIDRDGRASIFHERARRLLEEGPGLADADALYRLRYTLTNLIDDLADATNAAEAFVLAGDIVTRSCDLVADAAGQWRGAGKWVPRSLRAVDDALAAELDEAISLWGQGNRSGIIAFALKALDRAGGPVLEGFRSPPA